MMTVQSFHEEQSQGTERNKDESKGECMLFGCLRFSTLAAVCRKLTSHLHVLPPHLLADTVGASSEALSGDGEVVCI